MKIMINIPTKEFGVDIADKFQDFFERLKVETEHHLISNTNLLCGNYELETIEMFLNAFKEMKTFDEMTNKNIMCLLYPDTILEVSEDRETFDHLSKVSLLVPKQSVDWWNAKYNNNKGE